MKTLVTIILASCLMLSARAQSITLAWDENTDGITAGYRLYTTDPASNIIHTVNVPFGTTTNTLSLTNFIAGATFSFYVTAHDAAGLESEPSNVVTWTVPAPLTPPVLVSGGWTADHGRWLFRFAWTNQVDAATLVEMTTPTAGGVPGVTTYKTTNEFFDLVIKDFQPYMIRARSQRGTNFSDYSETQTIQRQSPTRVTLTLTTTAQ